MKKLPGISILIYGIFVSFNAFSYTGACGSTDANWQNVCHAWSTPDSCNGEVSGYCTWSPNGTPACTSIDPSSLNFCANIADPNQCNRATTSNCFWVY